MSIHLFYNSLLIIKIYWQYMIIFLDKFNIFYNLKFKNAWKFNKDIFLYFIKIIFSVYL